MSADTHLRHSVWITTGPDPMDTIVEIDGKKVPTALKVDVSLGADQTPTINIVHDCWSAVIGGEYRIEHHCGLTPPVDDSPTGYLGTVKVALREFASRVLLAGDVYGQQREEVLDQVDDWLDSVAIETARAVLDGAAKGMLRRVEDIEAEGSSFDDDALVLDGQAVRNLDLDPGVHALIRLPQASA